MYICRKCDRSVMYKKQKGPSIGMYCNHCDAWQKWLGKEELESFDFYNNKAIKEDKRRKRHYDDLFNDDNSNIFNDSDVKEDVEDIEEKSYEVEDSNLITLKIPLKVLIKFIDKEDINKLINSSSINE